MSSAPFDASVEQEMLPIVPRMLRACQRVSKRNAQGDWTLQR